jgi:hypothetical protein
MGARIFLIFLSNLLLIGQIKILIYDDICICHLLSFSEMGGAIVLRRFWNTVIQKKYKILYMF